MSLMSLPPGSLPLIELDAPLLCSCNILCLHHQNTHFLFLQLDPESPKTRSALADLCVPSSMPDTPEAQEKWFFNEKCRLTIYWVLILTITHSSVLAWRIPGMGEPGGLPSMGSHRVGHDWSDLAAAAAREEPGDPRYGVEPSQEPQQVAGIKDKNIDAGTSCPMFFLFTEVLEKVHLLTWVTTFPSISYFLWKS